MPAARTAEVGDESRPDSRGTLGPALLGGLVCGLLAVVVSLSNAALIFTGPLSAHLAIGLSLALVTAVIVGATVALSGSLPGTVAIPQDRIAPILGIIVATISAEMAGAADERVLATSLAALAAASVLTGSLLALLGLFRLGNLVRFIPLPVVGGFLAGSGWLLITGALRVMTGRAGGWSTLPELFGPDSLRLWLPGALLGVAIFALTRRLRHPYTVPLALVASVAGFYAWLALAGTTTAAARAAGLLPATVLDTARAPSLPELLGTADWRLVLGQTGSLATIFLVSVVAILLNATALELAAGGDVDLNRELRATGAGNVLAGLGGGMVGFHGLSLSLLALQLGARSRLTGLIAAGTCAVALLFGAPLLGFFPQPVLGGMIFYLGLTLVAEWIWDARARLPRSDWLIVLLILGVMGAFGYIEGVGIGLLAALVLFAVKYSRIDVVRDALSGSHHRSNVDRPQHHEQLLRREGDRVLILKLQGFIFFGTANNLLGRVRDRAQSPQGPPLRFLVLDFRRVSGVDSSAVQSLVKMREMARSDQFAIGMTHCPPVVRRQMSAAGLVEREGLLQFFPDLDHGIEWCENGLLAGGGGSGDEQLDLWGQLRDATGVDIAQLQQSFERMYVEAGTMLIRQDDPSEELYFIESGLITVWLELEGGRRMRLRTMRAGTVVGELGLYLCKPRSTSVEANESSVVWRLTREALDRLDREDTRTAAGFHRFMVLLTAERLLQSNAALRAYLD